MSVKRTAALLSLAVTGAFVFGRPSYGRTVAAKRDAAVTAAIEDSIRYVSANRCDVNGDGKVNCIDSAFMFYSVYEDFARENGAGSYSECRFVWNNNKANGFSHLFVRVRDSSYQWIFVETMVSPGQDWNPRVVWGTRYNSMCNNVELHDYWLQTMSPIESVRQGAFRHLNIRGW